MKWWLGLWFLSVVFGFDATIYSNTLTLQPDYTIYWNIQNNSIRLALQVQTLGWVGFGLGEATSGSMPGADIVTGWVINGVASIQDRYATVYAEPTIDDCQNWVLIQGEETNGSTILEMTRLLNTGDVQDRAFVGRNRIIFAFGLTDTLQYHETNRFFTAVTFFGPVPVSIVLGQPDIQTQTFINSNYSIPSVSTTYYEIAFPLFVLPQDVHLVRLETIVYAPAAAYVHHFLLYACQNTTCTSVIWAWAPGVAPLELPIQAGYRFGPSSTAWNGLKMQIHYNNPGLVAGVMDNSGILVYYTPNLRQYDADVLELADPAITNPQQIPGGTGLASYEYSCPSECTSTFPGTLTIFGDFLHMHNLGYMMYSTQWRNGISLGYLNRVEFWDFAFQQTTLLNRTLVPGDRINSHCVYQEDGLQTPFSLPSYDEMCLEYVYYYPKLTGPYCSFVYVQGRNFTLCGNTVLQTSPGVFATNPSLVDPPGGDARTFGVVNPAGFQCAFTNPSVTNSVANPLTAPSHIGGTTVFKLNTLLGFVLFMIFSIL